MPREGAFFRRGDTSHLSDKVNIVHGVVLRRLAIQLLVDEDCGDTEIGVRGFKRVLDYSFLKERAYRV